MITFGTPHGGAIIGKNILNGVITNFIDNSCLGVGDGPSREFITVPYVALANGIAIVLTGGGLQDIICEVIAKNYANSQTTNSYGLAVDTQQGSELINSLYSAPNIQKIAVFGVEDEPVFWRHASSQFSNVNDKPFFTADGDQSLVTACEVLVAFSLGRIGSLSVNSFLNPFSAPINIYKIIGWNRTKNKLQDLNQNYKAVITNPNTTFAFQYQCKVETYDQGSLSATNYFSANSPSECDQYTQVWSYSSEDLSSPVYNWQTTFDANDGLINATSATAWPGATQILMPGSNHAQMKNDSKLKDVLNRIYNANFSDPTINQFWKTLVR